MESSCPAVRVYAEESCCLLFKIKLVAHVVATPIKVCPPAAFPIEAGVGGVPRSFPAAVTPSGLISGSMAICAYLVREGNLTAARVRYLMGEETDVSRSWAEWVNGTFEAAECKGKPSLATFPKELAAVDAHLAANTFLGCHYLSVADIALYCSLSRIGAPAALPAKHRALQRWYSHLAAFDPWRKSSPAKDCPAGSPEAPMPDKVPAKKPDYLASLPHTNLNLEDFKRVFSNQPNRQDKVFLEEFWSKTFESDKWSFYHMKYDKLEDECRVGFVTSNQLNGFKQRIEPGASKVSMAVLHALDEAPNFNIEGMWLVRGTQIPPAVMEHVSFEYHTWEKMDVTKAADKDKINEMFFFHPHRKVQGRHVEATVQFK